MRRLSDRFWEKVDRRGPDDCWPWTGAITSRRYGHIAVDGTGRMIGAHRLSYELSVGPIGPGLWVLHRCDNPPCVNPRHLFAGTNQDNVNDKMAKGRARGAAKGEGHHRAKLTDAQVREVRRLYAAGGVTQQDLATRFSMSFQHISDLVNNRCRRAA